MAPPLGGPGGADGGEAILLGVDVGGTKLALGAVSAAGAILARKTVLLRTSGGGALSPEGAARVAAAFANDRQLQPARAGISVAAALDGAGAATFAPNLPAWQGEPVALRFEAALGVPATALYDGHAALLGEAWLGEARGRHNVVLLTVGTGVGGALMVDGRLAHGRDGLAGVFAYLQVPWRGRAARLEDAVSGPALARDLSLALGRQASAAEVFALARRGDAAAADLLAEALEALGGALAGIAAALNPECILLAGSVGLAYAANARALEAAVARLGQPVAGRGVAIRAAGLGGDAGWVGAARAALESARA